MKAIVWQGQIELEAETGSDLETLRLLVEAVHSGGQLRLTRSQKDFAGTTECKEHRVWLGWDKSADGEG